MMLFILIKKVEIFGKEMEIKLLWVFFGFLYMYNINFIIRFDFYIGRFCDEMNI